MFLLGLMCQQILELLDGAIVCLGSEIKANYLNLDKTKEKPKEEALLSEALPQIHKVPKTPFEAPK